MRSRNTELVLHPEDYSSAPAFGSAAAFGSSAPAFSVKDVLRTLRRAWHFPAIGFLIGVIVAVSYVMVVPKLYKSTTRILVDRSMNRYLQTNKIADEPTFDQTELESQIHILLSESIVVPVVRSLDLAHDPEFVGPPKGLPARILWSIGRLSSIVKQAMGLNGDTGPAVDSEFLLERTAVEALLKRLSVTREDVATVIIVTVEAGDPNKAADIANALADAYLASNVEAKSKSTKIARQWLQERLTKLRTQAAEAEWELQSYKTANNIVNSDKGDKGSPNADQLSSMRTQLANARMAMTDAKARLERIRETIGEDNPSATVTDALTNSVIVKLRSQYMTLAAKVAELEPREGAGHIAVVNLHRQMDDLRALIRAEEQRIAGTYASEYEIAKARETELAAIVAQLVTEAKTNSQAQVNMRELESSAETLRTLYNSFLQKFKEIDGQSGGIPVQDARVITRAEPPLQTSSSKKAVAVLAGSILLGLFLGAGAAIAREWLADVLRTPSAVEQVTDVPCVILPNVSQERGRKLIGGRSNLMEDFVLDSPHSRFTETLRAIKAMIHSAALKYGDDVKVIGIVSSVSKEGKTTIAANLAALMIASSGARTLLIDGDLHKRFLTAKLAPDAREGLLEALAAPDRLHELVTKKERSGVDVLPCVLSERITNAAELLGSREMGELLAVARKRYDYIIIEIAPIMSVVDIKMIERFVDRFIFVIEWGRSTRNLVAEALSEVQMIRERLIGVVLNKVDPLELRRIESYKGNRVGDYYVEDYHLEG
jgi:succinoglycan biosynthesis transport protein ExoP